MRLSVYRRIVPFLVFALGFLFPVVPLLAAQNHVVSPAELQQATLSAAAARHKNLAKVEKFFSSGQAAKALKSAHLDPVQIRQALPSLSDQELARLATRADKAQKAFAAGSLTNQQITYILIALGTAIVVLIATR